MTASPVDNCARFAAQPLTTAGTPASLWRGALAGSPELDMSGCPEIVVVAAHPDDETFGLGATASTLAARGVRVQVVVVSDGGASQPSLEASQSRILSWRRRLELADAAQALGLPDPICLGLPDGELRDHESRIADVLTDMLATRQAGTWCAANWRGDGHPDHEAVGRAAASATARVGATLLEYPVWMWHWASSDDTAVPWDRLHVTPLDPAAIDLKATAAQCYRSQLETTRGGDPPVLPSFVVDRLLAVREVVFV